MGPRRRGNAPTVRVPIAVRGQEVVGAGAAQAVPRGRGVAGRVTAPAMGPGGVRVMDRAAVRVMVRAAVRATVRAAVPVTVRVVPADAVAPVEALVDAVGVVGGVEKGRGRQRTVSTATRWQ